MHDDKVSINKRLVCEKFVAQHRRLTMVTNKFLAGVSCNSLICTFFSVLCLISYTVLQLRVRDFSAVVCGVARVAVLFVEVHLLMVIISHVSRRGGPEILHFGQKATALPPPPTSPTQTSSSGSIRFRYKVYILAEKEVSVR